MYGAGGGDLVAKLCLTLVTPWIITIQVSPFVGFPRQEYWSGLPFATSGELHDPGIVSSALAGGFFITEPPGKPSYTYSYVFSFSDSFPMWIFTDY